MGILLKEHIAIKLILSKDETLVNNNKSLYFWDHPGKKIIEPRLFKTERGQNFFCFGCKVSDTAVELHTNYFVGIDWLTYDRDRYIHVEPKLNTAVAAAFDQASTLPDESLSDTAIASLDKKASDRIKKGEADIEVDIIAMLMELMSHPEIGKHTDNLLLIDWDAPEISINQKQDLLTPFLVVRFLKILQDITRKGLKKSYYKVLENLRNKVKGKILIGRQIKQNVFKNRLTNTVCEYQVFGEDSIENRFLKKVFLFCTQYIENNTYYFKNHDNVSWIINYIGPSLEHISTDVDIHDIKHLKYNPFFREYKEAIKVGQHILKRFSYNITKATTEQVSTPPFWIDMPKMFELYVFAKFIKDNPDLSVSHFNYQLSTHGNALDFLICTGDKKIVVDTKYKLHYNYGQIHQDIRQVAGYARLKKIKNQVPNITGEIPCLIIYPKPAGNSTPDNVNLKLDNLLQEEIGVYHEVYKLGINLPVK